MKLASFLHILQTTSGPKGLLVASLLPLSSTIEAAALFSIRVIEFLALATTSLNPKSDPLEPDLGVKRGPPFPLGDIRMVLLELTKGTPTDPEELISCA